MEELKDFYEKKRMELWCNVFMQRLNDDVNHDLCHFAANYSVAEFDKEFKPWRIKNNDQ